MRWGARLRRARELGFRLSEETFAAFSRRLATTANLLPQSGGPSPESTSRPAGGAVSGWADGSENVGGILRSRRTGSGSDSRERRSFSREGYRPRNRHGRQNVTAQRSRRPRPPPSVFSPPAIGPAACLGAEGRIFRHFWNGFWSKTSDFTLNFATFLPCLGMKTGLNMGLPRAAGPAGHRESPRRFLSRRLFCPVPSPIRSAKNPA